MVDLGIRLPTDHGEVPGLCRPEIEDVHQSLHGRPRLLQCSVVDGGSDGICPRPLHECDPPDRPVPGPGAGQCLARRCAGTGAEAARVIGGVTVACGSVLVVVQVVVARRLGWSPNRLLCVGSPIGAVALAALAAAPTLWSTTRRTDWHWSSVRSPGCPLRPRNLGPVLGGGGRCHRGEHPRDRAPRSWRRTSARGGRASPATLG